MPIGEEQQQEGEHQEPTHPTGPSSKDTHQCSCRQRTWYSKEGIDGVFLQNIAECPQQSAYAEDPADWILWAARGDERADCGECQQNQGIKNITEQFRGRILHLKKQGNDGNCHIQYPCAPC